MNIDKNSTKAEIFKKIGSWLETEGYQMQNKDDSRPWGGFFVIQEGQIEKFRNQFFAEVPMTGTQLKNKLSPKILLVAPEKRLSWQYHHRRAEVWKLIAGEGAIIKSETNVQGELEKMKTGEVLQLRQGERHRLVGLENWGVVAEIWMHTDPENPSDEEDIVRVQDDFERK